MHALILEIGEFCIDRDIQLWLLKANTTHCCQPLDLSFFGPMKKYIQKYAVAWQHSHPGESLTKYTLVSEAAYPALEKCLQSPRSTVMSGFKKGGIFPWCPSNVDLSKLKSSQIYKKDGREIGQSAAEDKNVSTQVSAASGSAGCHVDIQVHSICL